jgi:hypothetical protein
VISSKENLSFVEHCAVKPRNAQQNWVWFPWKTPDGWITDGWITDGWIRSLMAG